MSQPLNPVVVIPARMGSSRLPGKPMVDIAGAPMIVHVWRRAIESQAGRVVVAADTREIVDAVQAAGGEAVLTRSDHASGSDRIFEALGALVQHYTDIEAWDELAAMYESALRSRQKLEDEKGMLLQLAMVHWRFRDDPESAEPFFARGSLWRLTSSSSNTPSGRTTFSYAPLTDRYCLRPCSIR